MDIANASLLVEGTAAAEAMMLLRRLAKNPGKLFFVSERCHPQTIAVVRTRAEPLGVEVVVGDELAGLPADAFGILLQYPASRGGVHDYADLANRAHAQDAMVRSEEHTSELQSLMRISYAVFCLKKKKLSITHVHPTSNIK